MESLTIGIITASNGQELAFRNCVNAILNTTASYADVNSHVVDLNFFQSSFAKDGFDHALSMRRSGIGTIVDLRQEISTCDGFIVVVYGNQGSEIVSEMIGSNALGVRLKPCAVIYLTDVDKMEVNVSLLKRAMLINILHLEHLFLVPGGWELCSEDFVDTRYTCDEFTLLLDNLITVTKSLKAAFSLRG
jgi:hypothetical protein